MAKSIGRRGYNAYLRAAKKRFGVTHSQARQMYRLQSAKAGGPINSRELTKHPIVSKRIATEASKPPAKKSQRRERAVSSTRTTGDTRRGGSEPSGKRGEKATPRRATSIRQWEQWYDEADEYEDMTVEAGIDTGKAGKK